MMVSSDGVVVLDAALLFRAVKELRETNELMPREYGFAVERHANKVRQQVLNSLLSDGDEFLRDVLRRCESRRHEFEVARGVVDE
jgi:hypothetical protein